MFLYIYFLCADSQGNAVR